MKRILLLSALAALVAVTLAVMAGSVFAQDDPGDPFVEPPGTFASESGVSPVCTPRFARELSAVSDGNSENALDPPATVPNPPSGPAYEGACT